MDRWTETADGFVVERKTKGSKVVTAVEMPRDHCLFTFECDCAICARDLYKPASATPETDL